MKRFVLTFMLMCFAAHAFACGIAGTAVSTEGKVIDDDIIIMTDWDRSRTYPKDGQYVLDLGYSACNNSVEVYVNGHSVGVVKLPSKGNVNVNIVVDSSTGYPVR